MCTCLQIVDVLGEECDGWWKGVLVEETKLKEGKEGVFPDNFVELLPQTPHGPLDGQLTDVSCRMCLCVCDCNV